jgi:signal peptidase I
MSWIHWIKDEGESWSRFFIELIILIGIVLVVRTFIFQPFRVSGPSMCPTMNWINNNCEYGKGEYIFVNELGYQFREPQRGEIVIFRPPNHKPVQKYFLGLIPYKGNEYYVKRIIGVGGDTIEIKNGRVYLSNETVQDYPLPENYLSARNQGRTQSFGVEKFEVPEGQYLLFGDNRAKSLDARQCFVSSGCGEDKTAFVDPKQIEGRAVFSIWPFWSSSTENSGWRFFSNEFDELEINQ